MKGKIQLLFQFRSLNRSEIEKGIFAKDSFWLKIRTQMLQRNIVIDIVVHIPRYLSTHIEITAHT